ncbi:MAG: hypothetical protein H7210_03845 [Pyrinomonadaceae bacterium]|nr:hypothetical protein [Phycisphaerales bacterium]
MKSTPSSRRATPYLVLAAIWGLHAGALAQPCTSTGPDVAMGTTNGVANYASFNGIEAFSVGTFVCNIGNLPVDYAAGTIRTPVLAQGLFRYRSVGPNGNARFEQLGQSWCYPTFFALSENLCCTRCIPTDGFTLGVHCTDPANPSTMGTQGFLCPKWQVNAATGAFVFPPANPPISGTVARRLQARISDLDPAQNGGGQYFVEHVAVSNSDAAAGNHHNNASHRPVNITGSGTAWTMAVTGVSRRERAAIQAWRMIDPDVEEVSFVVPGDGWFILAGRASQVDAHSWHYEYAIENLSSDRSGRAFHVPCPPSVVVSNIGFHDVDYHAGDGPGNVKFSGTDWPGIVTANSVSWATQTFAENQSANALRWGTLYNFRFDASTPPVIGTVTLDLFKPGTPASVSVLNVPVPDGPPICLSDWNRDGVVNSEDFFDFIADFFTVDADFNHDTFINSQDFFDFLAAFFAGC